MASLYPNSLDSFPDTLPTSPLTNPSHSGITNDVNDAVEALEVKVGVNGSADTSSLDYRVTQLEAGGQLTSLRFTWCPIANCTTNSSASSNATKGMKFVPDRDINLYGLYMVGETISSATYRGSVITVSGGTVATITNTNSVSPAVGSATSPDITMLPLEFASPVTLISGTTYYLCITNTAAASGTTSVSVALADSNLQNYPDLPGAVDNTSVVLASNNPIVGTTATVSTATTRIHVGMVWGLV